MKRWAICFLVLATVSLVQGADIRYHGSGDYFLLENQGQPEGWQSLVLPGSNDTIRCNWGNNTVTLEGIAPVVNRFQFGVNESGGMHVLSNGVLTTLNTSKVGNNDTCMALIST